MRKIGKSKANSDRVLRPLPLVNFLTQTAALSSGLRCLRSVNYPVTVIVFRSRVLVELGEEFVEVCINATGPLDSHRRREARHAGRTSKRSMRREGSP